MPTKKTAQPAKKTYSPETMAKVEQIYADFLLKVDAIYKKRDTQILNIIKTAEKRQIKALQDNLKK
ncbi:MAG: hypothetical protein Q7R99_04300 [bacterium]|nr:hypothetical protein [bacterium]